MPNKSITLDSQHKTRVYISSTLMDYGEFRNKVVSELVILGVDSFWNEGSSVSLSGILPYNYVKIRLSNIFVAIIGYRSGFIIPNSNMTATEYEMGIAKKLGLPILCYVTRDSPILGERAIDIQPVLENISGSTVARFVSTPEECSRLLVQDITQILNQSPPPDRPTKIEFERIEPSDFKTLLEHSDELIHCSPRKLEEVVAELLKADGWDVELVVRNNAPGPDIIAVSTKIIKDIPLKMIVECKKWAPDHPVDLDVVKKVMYWVNEEYDATLGMIATTSRFTSEAMVKATNFHQWRLALKDRNALLDWLKQHTKP